jgi:PhnB protein
MTEGALIDRLDRTIDAIMGRADATAALRDTELAPLARVAADLKHYPRPEFKARLIATALGGSAVPAGLRSVTPFVHATAASRYIEFLKQAFGAVEEGRHDAEGRVRYARLRIGNAALELGEAEGGADPMRSAFYLYVDNADLIYEQALAAGAKSLWPPADQPYGDRVGAVEDSIANQWFIARSA